MAATAVVAVVLLTGSGLVAGGRPAANLASGGSLLTATLSGPEEISLGQTASFVANASGGGPPYQFQWAVNGTEVQQNITSAPDSEEFTLRPTGDGIFVIDVIVADSGGNHTSQQLSLYVYGASPVSVVITLLGAGTDASVTLHASVVGGTAPYLYRWSGPGASANWTSMTNFTTIPLQPGTYRISVVVRDANAFQGGAEITVRSASASAGSPVPWWTWLLVGALAGLAVALAATLAVRRRRLRSDGSTP